MGECLGHILFTMKTEPELAHIEGGPTQMMTAYFYFSMILSNRTIMFDTLVRKKNCFWSVQVETMYVYLHIKQVVIIRTQMVTGDACGVLRAVTCLLRMHVHAIS